jgi:predicted nuclease with TOPRIM domain
LDLQIKKQKEALQTEINALRVELQTKQSQLTEHEETLQRLTQERDNLVKINTQLQEDLEESRKYKQKATESVCTLPSIRHSSFIFLVSHSFVC